MGSAVATKNQSNRENKNKYIYIYHLSPFVRILLSHFFRLCCTFQWSIKDKKMRVDIQEPVMWTFLGINYTALLVGFSKIWYDIYVYPIIVPRVVASLWMSSTDLFRRSLTCNTGGPLRHSVYSLESLIYIFDLLPFIANNVRDQRLQMCDLPG